jgi:multidrug efflux pump subunit AcrA (membrane-fusion protein)
VAAGTPVVRVAKQGEKEVVIGMPEDKVDSLRRVSDVQIRLWADPQRTVPGKIREISPVADAATRTYTVKGHHTRYAGRRQAGHDGRGAVRLRRPRRRSRCR